MLHLPVNWGHNSFKFNEQVDAAGLMVPAFVQNTVLLDEVIVTPGYRDLRDPYHLAQGGALGRVHKGFLVIRMRGRIEVPDASQQASLDDRDRAMRAAFDPYQCFIDSPTTEGAYALDHSTGTTDTATYPSGFIPLRYYARPVAQPEISEILTEGPSRQFRIALVAGDPRLYEQTERTALAFGGTITNRGTTRAPCKLTIVMNGAGGPAVVYTLGSQTITLDLSGLVNNDVLTVLMETSGPYGNGKTVLLNGANAFARKTSGPATWLYVPPGTTAALSNNNNTNVRSSTLAWYDARA
jgi:hypothetical protein